MHGLDRIAWRNVAKVFGFFFSKKKGLLYFKSASVLITRPTIPYAIASSALIQ
jgi:hypothetical protein